VTSVQSS